VDQHNLQDPVRGMDIGEYRNPDMREAYARLVAQGLKSLEDSVQVGLLIEELDIADLRDASMRIEKLEILSVYSVYADLERGSRNHLHAFYRWMKRLNIFYAPAHLAREDFISMAESEHEYGH